jgi:prophage maintenance system killer protein
MLDLADLAVIAGRTLAISTDAAVAQMDIAAAQDALAEARSAGQEPGMEFRDREAAAAAGVALMRALLRHRPFREHGQQVAVAAALQFLSLNGWRADLNPAATAVVVVEALASGQLTCADAAVWLSPRLSPARRTTKAPVTVAGARPWLQIPLPVVRVPVGQTLAGALLAVTVAGAALLAAACSRAPYVPAAPSGGASVVRQSTGPESGRPADSAYAAWRSRHPKGEIGEAQHIAMPSQP